MELCATGVNLPQSYHQALYMLRNFGKWNDCPDWDCKCLEAGMTIEVEHPTSEPMISRLFIGGPRELEQYRMEMLDGILDFEIEKGNWKYTYHDRFKDQLPFIIEELKRNPYSRRAVISIRTPEDIGSDDPACMQHIQFQIRDGKLEMYVLFRSNDACKASFMNMFALICLQERIAGELGVDVGRYVHRANNYHCYEKDYPLLESYVNRARTERLAAVSYNYKGDDGWQELMEEERPEILSEVEKLKGGCMDFASTKNK